VLISELMTLQQITVNYAINYTIFICFYRKERNEISLYDLYFDSFLPNLIYLVLVVALF